MGISYFVEVPPAIMALLRVHPSVPHQTVVHELLEPEALVPVMRQNDQPIDLVALGPGLGDPLRVAQQIHQVDKQIPLLLLCQPEQYPGLTHALRFTPLLGREVRCLAVQDAATTVAAMQDMVQRTMQRRIYRTQLHTANQQLADLAIPRPSATDYLGRLLDYAPIGIATLDSQGRVVGWNRTASTLLQRSEREVIGQPFVALFAADEQVVVHAIHAQGDQGLTTDYASRPTLVQTTTAHGQAVWLQMTAAPLPVPADRRGTLLLFEDVTARMHAEQAREASQHRLAFLAELGLILGTSLDYHTTLARLAEALVPTLADWCIVDLVESDQGLVRVAVATTEADRAQALHTLRERYPPTWDSPQPAAEALRQRRSVLYPAFSAESLAATVRDPDHLALLEVLNPQSALAVPLLLQGRLLGALTLARTGDTPAYTEQDLRFAEDVANRAALVIENARLYAEAQAAIQLRDEFLSLAAHELKTPVTTVLGSAQLLQRQLAQVAGITDRERRRVQILLDQAWRLQRLIQTLLDPARIAAGHLDIAHEAVDLSQVVQQTLDALQPMVHTHQIATQGLDRPCIIEGDPLRLEQVVQNILQNAIKYSPHGGTIRVELVQQAAGVDLTIRDEGIGIPADDLARVTEQFYRATNVRTGTSGGMGIGLYLVKAIVAAHQGTLQIESEQGVGTQIRISLPRSGGAEAQEPPRADD